MRKLKASWTLEFAKVIKDTQIFAAIASDVCDKILLIEQLDDSIEVTVPFDNNDEIKALKYYFKMCGEKIEVGAFIRNGSMGLSADALRKNFNLIEPNSIDNIKEWFEEAANRVRRFLVSGDFLLEKDGSISVANA